MFILDAESSQSGSGKQDYFIAPMAYSVAHADQLAAPAMWHLGSAVPGGARIGEAWKYSLGTGVTIGIVDEGVNYRHADLAWSYDATIDYDPRDDGDFDAMIDLPTQRHGTNVAGLIAGDMANDFGTVGGSQGSSFTATFLRYGDNFRLSELADIVRHQANYDVSNNSWGFTSPFADNFSSSSFAATATAFSDAVGQGRGGLGTVFVFAAGNGKLVQNGVNIGDDAGFHNLTNSRFTIAVGAHDANGDVAFFSNPGASVLLTAPGMSLRTTNGAAADATTGSYVSGTSFAAPLVSSTVALMLAANPELGYRDVQEILALSAQSRLDGATTANGATNFNGGGLMFGRDGGFGMLDAAAAVNLARHWDRQSTAFNEQCLDLQFGTPVAPDKVQASLEAELRSPDGNGFSTDRVELELDLFDKGLKDLTIALISPDGTRTIIAESLASVGSRTSLKFEFGSVANWGEDPFGTWKVELVHSKAPSTFIAFDAKLHVYGDWDIADDTHYITASFRTLVGLDADRAVIRDDDGGTDTLNFVAARSPVTVDLSGETANSIDGTSFVLADAFENVIGTVYGDHVVGSTADNRLVGDDGNDVLLGRAGNDRLDGGLGDDTLDGGAGADIVAGGEGHDTLILGGSFSDYTITRDGASYSIIDATSSVDVADGIEAIAFDDVVVDLTLDPDVVVDAVCRIEAITVDDVHTVGRAAAVTQVAVVTASDPNLAAGDTLHFSLVGAGGAPYSGPFDIVAVAPGTAVVRLLGSVTGDFDLSVRVSDSMGNSDTQGLSVSIGRSNTAPLSVSVDGSSIVEGDAGGIVGILHAIDPDGDGVTFSVDDARFEVLETEIGAFLKLKEGVSLDYEVTSQLSVTVMATDAGGLSVSETFEVSVTDLNEAPAGSASLAAVVEQGAYRAALDIAPLVDPEGDAVTYTVTSLAVGGHIQQQNGTTIAIGDVLTEEQLVSLVYTTDDDAGTGLLTFLASDGDNTQTLTVVADVREAVSATYNGTASSDLIDGAGGNDLLRGLRGDDLLYGGSGDDTLNGGIGADHLVGGAGNDTYMVDQAGDFVTEVAGGGVDMVIATGSYNLGAGQEIEILRLAATTATRSANLTGNELGQIIIGNAGQNRIDDGGGRGIDTLRGLGGNDTYFVRSSETLIREGAAEGSLDVVATEVSYKLGLGVYVEKLYASASSSTDALSLTGNTLSQTIIGNAGANRLDDGGGAGIDVLRGLGGNDTYVVRNSGTVLREGADEGALDTVTTTVSYTLSSGVYVEKLSALSLVGTDAIDLSGNQFAQTIVGNDGDNIISGRGGNDVLTGRGGADDFVFDTRPSAANVDRITDFNVAEDTILLQDTLVFTKISGAGDNGLGTLLNSQFVSSDSGQATNGNHRIIYDSNDGLLYYDSDGTGAADRVLFATLGKNLGLTHADFNVI